MAFELQTFIDRCQTASGAADASAQLEQLLREAVQDPEGMASALSGYSGTANLEDLIVFRSDKLTLMHVVAPPGFTAAPHNHNLWSVVAVYDGQEDNHYFERQGDSLAETGAVSVVAPDVVHNPEETIHSIHNPRETPLRALHAYGGDLLGTERSNWDPATHAESPFEWSKVAKQ